MTHPRYSAATGSAYSTRSGRALPVEPRQARRTNCHPEEPSTKSLSRTPIRGPGPGSLDTAAESNCRPEESPQACPEPAEAGPGAGSLFPLSLHRQGRSPLPPPSTGKGDPLFPPPSTGKGDPLFPLPPPARAIPSSPSLHGQGQSPLPPPSTGKGDPLFPLPPPARAIPSSPSLHRQGQSPLPPLPQGEGWGEGDSPAPCNTHIVTPLNTPRRPPRLP